MFNSPAIILRIFLTSLRNTIFYGKFKLPCFLFILSSFDILQ